MSDIRPHIAVCICTYKRPQLLKRLLQDLAAQEAEGLFSYSIVVADNDELESAKPMVSEFAASSPLQVLYCVEPEQNIALTRNKALANAKGDFIAFVDDDQFLTRNWLLTLFKACKTYGVDGVLGPVKPYFEVEPPNWVVKGQFFERASYETGYVIDWPKGRTGNLLFKRQILDSTKQPFRSEFLTAEDQDFFRRMIEKGHVFIWCNEAVAYEVVPPARWKRTFLIKRALLRGRISRLHPKSKVFNMIKSLIALPLYALALPFLLILGQHIFTDYLIRSFDHIGRILALFGFDPVKERYVTH